MRWLSRLLVMVVMVGSTSLWAADGDLPGSGSEGDPYLIEDLADFDRFSGDPNYWADDVYTKLACDPNLAGRRYTTAVIARDTSISDGFQGSKFTGVFDGDGHVIRNLTINTAGAANGYLGLFGYIEGISEGSSAKVKNLGMENIYITGGYYSRRLGGLCGWNWYGTISNCYATGSITGGVQSGSMGGLCGSNNYGTISHCYASASVTGGDPSGDLGGLCGRNHYGKISHCYASGSVASGFQSIYLGGLCGWNSGTITQCFATGPVTGENSIAYLGGLCGSQHGTISHCYATGSVIGGYNSFDLGGLCGRNHETISHCYATGPVTAGMDSMHLGGLSGENLDGTISNSWAMGAVAGGENSYDLGGLCGLNREGAITNCFWDIDTGGPDNGLGAPLPTAQMQTLGTFVDAGWDFINVWNVGEKQTYPYLRTYWAADINKDRAVNVIDLSIIGEQWMGQ